jgi:uncharacterized oxidoreductase
VLITGGGAGIGAGLARELYARGTAVIVAGRTRAKLDELAAAHPGAEVEVVDVSDAKQVYELAGRLSARHPGLDALINSAGLEQALDFAATGPVDPDAIDREIDTNLRGLIHVSNAFLPLLKRQGAATLVQVGSGLGFVPLAAAPVYSATKAAVHSFTVSLRRQLAGSPVRVVEIIPPAVDTGLHRSMPNPPPGMMKPDAFVARAMRGLDAGRLEVSMGSADLLRIGGRIAPSMLLRLVNSGPS